MHKPHKTILVRKIGPGTGRAAVVTKVQRGMQTTRSDDPLAEYALDSRLAGDIPAHMTGEIHTVRDVAVHSADHTTPWPRGGASSPARVGHDGRRGHHTYDA